MKKLIFFSVILIMAGAMLFAAGKPEAKKVDYLSLSWDQLTAEAKKEGSVTFYTWLGEDFFKSASQKFKEKYGIDVNVIIGDRTANQNKVLAEKDKEVGTIDAMHVGGGDMVKATIAAGAYYGPILPVIPHAGKLDPKLSKVQEGIATNGFLAPGWRNQTGLLFDPERVSDPPQTWEQLVAWIKANPKQFAFCDPSKGGSGQAFVQTAIGYLCGGLDKYQGDTELVPDKINNWDVAWKWFNDIENMVTITGSNNESVSRLNEGEVSLVVAWDDNVLQHLKKGTLFKRAKLYIPSLGLPGGGDTYGVLKNAPNKAAGILWVAFLTDSDTQVMMNDIMGSTIARTDVKGKNDLLTEDERQKNGVIWIPGPYKAKFIADFVQNVLMKEGLYGSIVTAVRAPGEGETDRIFFALILQNYLISGLTAGAVKC